MEQDGDGVLSSVCKQIQGSRVGGINVFDDQSCLAFGRNEAEYHSFVVI